MKQNAFSGIYGFVVLGAAVYYLRHAATFGAGAFGIIKAVLWPAVLTYRLFDYFKL